MTDSLKATPLTVRVSRIKHPEMADLDEDEIYVGYLVDEEGNFLDAPRVGESIYLAGDDESEGAFLFITAKTESIAVHQGFWIAKIGDTCFYKIENERTIN